MGRPRKVVRDTDKPARSFSEIQRIIDMAQQFYELTGGASLDLQLRSLDRNAELFQLQTDACVQYGPEAAAAYGPNVSSYEARMSASTYARLSAQREKKMAQCMAWAEEGAEEKAVAASAGNGTADSVREAATVGPEVAPPAESSREPLEPKKDGDSPQKRGQSPSGKSPAAKSPAPEAGVYEFVDATGPTPSEPLTKRISELLTSLPSETQLQLSGASR